MEMKSSGSSDFVVDIQAVLCASLVLLGVIFLLAFILNLPAIVVYTRSRQIRGLTDKFILFVLITDLVSLFLFLPISFVFLLEYSQELSSSHDDPQNDGVREAAHPIFIDDENYMQIMESEVTSEDQFSTHCLQQWTFILHKFAITLVANISTLAALMIAFERYLAVVTPLHYHRILNSSTIFLVSATSWLISLVFAVISTLEPNQVSTSIVCKCASELLLKGTIQDASHQVQSVSVQVSNSDVLSEVGPALNALPQASSHSESHHVADSFSVWWPVLKVGESTVFFIIPVIVMVCLYLKIWIEARKQNARMMRHKNSLYILPADGMKTGFNVDSNSMQPIVSKFKLMERLKRRTKMDRAARVAVLTTGLVIFSFGPLQYQQLVTAISRLTNPTSPVCRDDDEVATYADVFEKLKCIIPTLVACFHPLLSPVVYVYRYARVRSETAVLFKKMISLLKLCSGQPTDCPRAGHQFNHLSQTLPDSSSCSDSTQRQILESQGAPYAEASPSTESLPNFTCTRTTDTVLEGFSTEGGQEAYATSTIAEYCAASQQAGESSEFENDSQDLCKHSISFQSTTGLFGLLTGWMSSYSGRWNQHRDSVTSTASFVTLLSTRSKSIPNGEI